MKDIWRRLARPGVDQRRKHPLEPASPKRAIAASADQAPPPNEGAFDGQAEQESSAPGWSSVEEVSEALVAVATTLKWIALATLALVVVSSIFQVILLIFAGVLLAVLLRSSSTAIASHTSVSPGVALASVLLATAAILAVAGWLLAPQIADQSQQLVEQLPKLWQQVRDRFGDVLGARVLEQAADQLGSPGRGTVQDLLGRVFGVVSGTLGALGSALVIFFTGLYLAVDPQTYRHGLVRLVPIRHHLRADEILDQMGDTLLWWLIGKLISMTLVGVLTFLGLWFLDIPLALTLALIACALTFIPNFGPILSAAPAVLLALGESVTTAGYVVALYVAVQTIESYLVTPLIQQRTVSLPPALTLGMQLIFGVLAGATGLALATPLTAAGLVLVRELYVRRIRRVRRLRRRARIPRAPIREPTMTQLSDTQALILRAAAQRPEHIALPLPESLRGGAAAKVVGAMLTKGFLEEVDANMRKGEHVWRETGEGHGVTLVATDAGLAAIGVETEAAPKARTPREGTKQATLIAMLRAPEGVTIEEIMAATGWQSHTVRGAMAGALKKKLGLEVASEKVEGRGRVYKLPAA